METSEQINELATALAKAQGDMEGAARGRENPFFKSKYATLAHVREALRFPLSKNGLAVTQTIGNAERGVRVTTMLIHSSGQWVRDTFDVPATKFDAQGLGSAATYGLRYSLQAITGIAPDDASDDDGNHATEHAPRREEKPKRQRQETNGHADQPQMSPEEFLPLKADADAKCNAAKTVEELTALFKTLPPQVQTACKPLFSKRRKVIEGDPFTAELAKFEKFIHDLDPNDAGDVTDLTRMIAELSPELRGVLEPKLRGKVEFAQETPV